MPTHGEICYVTEVFYDFNGNFSEGSQLLYYS